MIPFDPTVWNVAVVLFAFIAGGTVKGVLGIGIPLVAVPLLVEIMPPATTISLLVIPILAANVWQGVRANTCGLPHRRCLAVLCLFLSAA